MYFIFGCTKSSLLPEAFSSRSEQGLLSSCRVQASHCSDFSCCRPWVLGMWDQLWPTGLVAPWHVGSSRTKDGTHVPCIGNWFLNHWTTREVPNVYSCLLCHSLGDHRSMDLSLDLLLLFFFNLWIFYPIPSYFLFVCLLLCQYHTVLFFSFLAFIYLVVSSLSCICGIFYFSTQASL